MTNSNAHVMRLLEELKLEVTRIKRKIKRIEKLLEPTEPPV